jgi:hypothetical protein
MSIIILDHSSRASDPELDEFLSPARLSDPRQPSGSAMTSYQWRGVGVMQCAVEEEWMKDCHPLLNEVVVAMQAVMQEERERVWKEAGYERIG